MWYKRTWEPIFWGEAFAGPDGALHFCASPETPVPVALNSGSELVGQMPYFLVSEAAEKANLHALPIDGLDALTNLKKTYCRMSRSLIDLCFSDPTFQPRWKMGTNKSFAGK
ncbi:Hypothetical predicted protein [Cloeon dipterum]|uniref:Uncharacterized protein n=1 Tax=Cloeon dipterum TaxID=197152 RepID=A0A8S1DEM7_9INSE|nr:Hypothetical predicted protein [Cloeon dipterum]